MIRKLSQKPQHKTTIQENDEHQKTTNTNKVQLPTSHYIITDFSIKRVTDQQSYIVFASLF